MSLRRSFLVIDQIFLFMFDTTNSIFSDFIWFRFKSAFSYTSIFTEVYIFLYDCSLIKIKWALSLTVSEFIFMPWDKNQQCSTRVLTYSFYSLSFYNIYIYIYIYIITNVIDLIHTWNNTGFIGLSSGLQNARLLLCDTEKFRAFRWSRRLQWLD